MTPAARVQAAIEILEQIIVAAHSDGAPADVIVADYFRARRYAGSGDRRAVRELVFRAIRHSADPPASGRSAMLALDDMRPLFDSSPHGPEVAGADETAAAPGIVPRWLAPHLSALVGEGEYPALVERAPLDLRVNLLRTTRDHAMAAFPDATPTPHSPWGLRLAPDTRISDHPAFRDGRVEVQDEGSQLIALACAPAGPMRASDQGVRVVDLCAGAGGKSLALAAAAPDAQIIACDTNRQRLAHLSPRAFRAGARIEQRLLDLPREAAALADLKGKCDIVLVDAPCSGSGTWRRNPEGRWRLSPDWLDRLAALQARVLDLAAPLVRPGGALVYAVCSLLSREGEAQAAAFLSRHSQFRPQDLAIEAGRVAGTGRLLTPAHDGTDGFFIARFVAA
jgi:16S rRNA (cytosine967-C5)-methyltransferase